MNLFIAITTGIAFGLLINGGTLVAASLLMACTVAYMVHHSDT